MKKALSKTLSNSKKFFTCPECGLKYAEKEIAKQCEAWCREHKSCNLDIIKHAVKDSEDKSN